MEVAGIPEEKIRPCAGTGLIVDIKGDNQELKREKALCIALRADIDGLKMKEEN
jgi:metal-dependent amidase/aminoacylase/carboxypeptidase family protein